MILHIPALGDAGIKPIHPAARFYDLADGESFWPEYFAADELRAIRVDLGTARFNACYQGDPTAMGGDVFKDAAWFKPLPLEFDRRDGDDQRTPRERCRYVMGVDFAFSEKETADWTALTVLGVDATNRWFVVGAWRGRARSDSLVDAVVSQWEVYEPHVIGIEQGLWERYEVVKDTVQRIRALVPATVLQQRAVGDKVARAMLLASRAEGGQVYADREAPWFPAWEQEHLGFPKALHDDWVDSSSLAAALASTRMAYRYEDGSGPARLQKYTHRRH